MDKKICRACESEKELRLFRIRTCKSGLAVDNICLQCRSLAERAKLKLDMISALGGKCNCCGENHPCFLTLEHIIPVGHRKQTRQCLQLLRDARRENWDRTKYELLCLSCNAANSHFGQCPHRSGVTAEQELERLRRLAGNKIGYSHRKTSGEFKPGPDERRTDGQFKDGHEYIGPKKSEQVVQ